MSKYCLSTAVFVPQLSVLAYAWRRIPDLAAVLRSLVKSDRMTVHGQTSG